ncbi:hypothetical protein ACF1G5_24190 [Streptomyces coeruleorubidus]|uniref:hypothetical protein n=1 Tax=Streptomyces coeruleorubidus TaxID=116188 RepID=UPI0036FF9C0B
MDVRAFGVRDEHRLGRQNGTEHSPAPRPRGVTLDTLAEHPVPYRPLTPQAVRAGTADQVTSA